MSRVSVYITGHGEYPCQPELLDRAIEEYLPVSAAALRAIVCERTPEIEWPPLTVSESLIVLASFYHDNRF